MLLSLRISSRSVLGGRTGQLRPAVSWAHLRAATSPRRSPAAPPRLDLAPDRFGSAVSAAICRGCRARAYGASLPSLHTLDHNADLLVRGHE
jgi:hypothetical protein